MKARFWALALALGLAAAGVANAQVQSGTISGEIRDQQGGVLPGVLLTLQGDGPVRTFVTETNGQYRFLNVPPGTYTLTATLQGFRTLVREGIVVAVGQSVQLPITLSVAAVEESVTVTGESPIVDSKAMGTATNFTQDELSRVPNSRDPWALLRTVPGVTLDRVNIAGNETGQQSAFVSKGARQGDAVWTMDGVMITDMATFGASPTYFDYDAFDEIQISTGGNDIRQPTGGVGLNFVVKRGTNQFRGTARGYYTEDGLEAVNVPAELQALGVTGETADHNQQIADYGVDFGGPLVKDKLFFWGSFGNQDIRLYRQSARGTDRTILKTYNAKINWQATSKDMVNFLFFNGDKIKNGRAPGNALFEPTSARWNQSNFYEDNPLKGLWKWEDNHVVSSNLFVTGRYAYYNTGFTLTSIGSLSDQMGISPLTGQTYGSTNANNFQRPQHTVNIDANHFRSMGSASHDFKFGFGWRRVDAISQTLYPGNMVVAYENSLADFRARVYREGRGGNRGEYLNLYLGDTISFDRLTLDLGVRYDRQGGKALPSETLSNAAFPNLVPGIKFDGYDAPFKWNDVTPRIGMTYALDESRRTILRASFSRNASQMSGIGLFVGYANPSSAAGWVEYRWVDANGDHLAQTGEVLVNQPLLASGGGFNTANPTAVTSANRIDPDLRASVGTGFIVGVDRELVPNLAVQANYTYSRVTGHPMTPFIGLTTADWAPSGALTGTTPDGIAYNIPLFIPDAAKVAAVGGGRLLTNFDDYYTTYNGVELSIIKRMSNRWMMRLAAAWNNPTEHYDGVPVSETGNPTRTDIFPLNQGGQWAPRSAGSGSGDVFVNQKWNFNVNGAYQLGWDIEVAGNLFGKQGTPYPYFRNQALGREGNVRLLLTPDLDTIRFEDLWNLDLRLAKNARIGGRGTLQLTADLFNVFNSNTEITRERNAGATTFRRLGSNLSPRILRFGVRIGI
ncbi:MAG: carboxypeptidase regulatory-like domain-containing protein [Acidobacteriota bacterium]